MLPPHKVVVVNMLANNCLFANSADMTKILTSIWNRNFGQLKSLSLIFTLLLALFWSLPTLEKKYVAL